MAEPLDPQKFHILSDAMKKRLTIFGLLFGFFVLLPLSFMYYKVAVNRPSPLDREITFEINQGESVAEISRNLFQVGTLNSEFLFSLYIFLNKQDQNIQAGIYKIKAGASIVELAEQFQHGVTDTRITFIEGWRVEEFARVASQQFEKIDYTEFVRKAAKLEGYLFPDTYYFDREVQEDEMIAELTNTFAEKTKDVLTEEVIKRVDLTKSEIVTLASIVEREINKVEDRPIVAGILIKRLKSEEILGADATTQYAVAYARLCGKEDVTTGLCPVPLEDLYKFNWWETVTATDLAFDSPYNTRKVGGIPPAPISSVSLSALRAVVDSETTEYMYYLTDTSGNTHYAVTLEDHNANVERFLR